ncbi:hypothetical protein C0J52_05022 [Blattella germanica]|nr:hypothetical protein C0J52_05022 [Blattella germanica]
MKAVLVFIFITCLCAFAHGGYTILYDTKCRGQKPSYCEKKCTENVKEPVGSSSCFDGRCRCFD